MKSGYVLAFDFGLRHIGVAVGQSITRTANPLKTLEARNGRPDWNEIEEMIHQWQPVSLLVGLPLNMDDSESEMSGRARQFGAALARRSEREVQMVDERLSSHASRETDSDRSHELAAALIAETWLAEPDSGTPPTPPT